MNKHGRTCRLLILSLISTCLTGCEVSLELLDNAGDVVSEVYESIPFIVAVVVKGDCSPQEVVVPGIEKFVHEQLPLFKSVTTINGHATFTHKIRYRLHTHHVGKQSVGPAAVTVGGKIYHSNVLTFQVKNKSAQAITFPKNELILSRQKIYAGEAVDLTVKVWSDTLLRLRPLRVSLQEADTLADSQGWQRSQEEYDGKMRWLYEWKQTVSPRQIGTVTVPSVAVEYEREQQDLFGFHFFARIRALHSNVATLTVLPLPPGLATKAVGRFNEFTMITDTHNVTDNSAAVITLALKGKGNWHAFSIPSLEGVADAAIYRQGEKQISETEKQFEFVVQPKRQGKITIPAQKFVFFNPGTKKYHTLTTTSVAITAAVSQKKNSTPQQNVSEKTLVSLPKKQLLPLVTHGSYVQQRTLQIPWLWFFIACFFPFALFVGQLCWKVVAQRFFQSRRYRKKLLQQALAKAKEENNITLFVRALQRFVADDRQCFYDVMTIGTLKNMFCSEAKKQKRWLSFLLQLEAALYTDNENKNEAVWNEAAYWVEQL